MDTKRLYGESENGYIARMYKNKVDLGLTCNKLSDIINAELGTTYGESTLRGRGQYFNEGYEEGYEKALTNSKGENSELTNLKLETETRYEQIKSYKETVEINKDGSYTSDKLIGVEDESTLKDENYLLECHGYDSKVWQIVSARNSKWNVQLKGGKVSKLYASRINVKPRVNDISVEEMKEWFKGFDRKNKTVKKIKHINTDSDLLFELPLVDLHYGKKGYSFEIGQESNSELTENNFFEVITDYIHRLEGKNISKILFPIGNDMFNSDTSTSTTTKGTPQDNDMRWKEMFKKGMEIVIQGIEMLSEVAPVEVVYVEGNHDTMTSFYLLMTLLCYFRKDEEVNIIEDVKTRQYIQWGKCLIGYAHGDCEKSRIGKLMQIEVPTMWGETLYREWHLAHLHHETSKEDGGITIRHLPTITGSDCWHSKSGFVGALQRCQAFLWDKNKGVVDIMYSQIN